MTRIPLNIEQFPDAKPGDVLDLMATGTISDDGKFIIVNTVEDTPLEDEEIDEEVDEEVDEDIDEIAAEKVVAEEEMAAPLDLEALTKKALK